MEPFLSGEKQIEFREREEVYFGANVLDDTGEEYITFVVGNNEVMINTSELYSYTKGEPFTISMYTMNVDDPNLVSDVVVINVMMGSRITTFAASLDEVNMIYDIVFQVDPDKITNWEYLDVRAYDDDGNIIDDFVGGVTHYDVTLGLVYAFVFGPGNYGIVQLDPADFAAEEPSEKENPTKKIDAGTNNTNVHVNQKRPTGTLEDSGLYIREVNGKLDTSAKKNDKRVSITNHEPRDYGVGAKPKYQYFLPNTATNMHSYLLAGTVALLSGLGTFFFLHRRELKTRLHD